MSLMPAGGIDGGLDAWPAMVRQSLNDPCAAIKLHAPRGFGQIAEAEKLGRLMQEPLPPTPKRSPTWVVSGISWQQSKPSFLSAGVEA